MRWYWLRTAAVVMAVSPLTVAAAKAASKAPAVARTHSGVAGSKLIVANRAALLRAHPRMKATYRWEATIDGTWSNVRNADKSTLVLPASLRFSAVRVVLTFASRTARTTLTSNVSLPQANSDAAAPSISAGTRPPTYVPSSWHGPNPPSNCAGSPHNGGSTAENRMLIDLDYCGATLEGLDPLVVPTNWSQLSDTQQGFVLLNLERLARGETPLQGDSSTLDGYAMDGAQANDDPDPNSGSWTGSNWYGGTDSADAVGGYIYNDGPGSNNLACSAGATQGCWGHRDNILDNSTAPDLDVGLADGNNGDSTEIFGEGYTDFTFSWANEVAAGYPTGLPTSFAVTAPAIESLSARGRHITITGKNLDTVTSIYFSNVTGGTSWTCSTPTVCAFTAPDDLHVNTTYMVYLVNPAGLSAAAPAGQYVAGY